MATVVAHAAVPLLLRTFVTVPPRLQRRLAVTGVLLACWPDLDYATLAFEVRPNELLGHRGLTHSLIVALLVAAMVTAVAFRTLRGTPAFWQAGAFLSGAAASHGLLDAMTAGDIGVALFAPLTSARFSLFKLIPTCPGGVDELFGYWGLLTVANEMLYVVIPLALAVDFVRSPDRRRRVLTLAGAWAGALVALRLAMPDEFRPFAPRVLLPVDTPQAGELKDVPRDGLPDGKLVTRLAELRALGLFDRALEPDNKTWSSSFFPTWFGGEGGRWMDGAPTLVWRTLFGFSVVKEADARALLAGASAGDVDAEHKLFGLSPAEKVDLALGRFDFPAASQSIARTHNARPKPRYWSGRCNGIAAASLARPEPFRVVDVITADGARVRFHPNDIKSLLALAYDEPETLVAIGEVCTKVGFDVPATCSMNAAVLLITALNRIGLAHRSFLVDALPTIAKQYYAVARVTAHLRGEPRPMDGMPALGALAEKVSSLVDVDLELVLASTTLPYARANVAISGDSTRYEHVGLVPVVMRYSATLALDASGELIGSRWTGDPPDGPDDVVIADGAPKVDASGNLASANAIPWSLVDRLAWASTEDMPGPATVHLREH